MSRRKRIDIDIEPPVGVKSAFWSGGSFRIVLPKWMARKYGNVKRNQPITEETTIGEVPFLFYPTDRGVLMVPFDQAAKDSDLRETFGFRAMPEKMIENLKRNLEELDKRLEAES